MATVKYSLDKEDKHYEIVQAAGSAVTKQIELTVEDVLTKQEIVVGLQQIIENIVRKTAN
jgi:hypothetical protein